MPRYVALLNGERETMDATAIGAVLSVIGSIVVFVVLGVRITRLMKTTQSED